MALMNEYFNDLKQSYLFAEVARRTKEFGVNHPEADIIKLGIGDVTLPLAQVVVDAFKAGCDEMGKKETFKGYPDYEGYEFLRTAIANYYKSFGVTVSSDEICINDGAKSDTANFAEIFSKDSTVLVTNPVYPVYVDSNIMAGRKIIYADCTKENSFSPMPDENVKADLIYLCSPNNPTGSVFTEEQLKAWVDYAIKNEAVIIYDSAYEAFITDKNIPRSIFAIEGARKCAIECCSLSKTAGFTGVRCGYTVIPQELYIKNNKGESINVYKLWYRRLGTKFNGVSYPVQRAAAAVFTEEGQKQIKENLAYYQQNAKIIADALSEIGIWYCGGKNSPYIWLKTPGKMDSWQFFDYLLEHANVVGTPGSGFGSNGEGYFRLTAFGDRQRTIEAVERIKKLNF